MNTLKNFHLTRVVVEMGILGQTVSRVAGSSTEETARYVWKAPYVSEYVRCAPIFHEIIHRAEQTTFIKKKRLLVGNGAPKSRGP